MHKNVSEYSWDVRIQSIIFLKAYAYHCTNIMKEINDSHWIVKLWRGKEKRDWGAKAKEAMNKWDYLVFSLRKEE